MDVAATMTSSASSLKWAWTSALDQSPIHGEGPRRDMPPHSVLFRALRCWQRIMAFRRSSDPAPCVPSLQAHHSVIAGSWEALEKLSEACRGELPEAVLRLIKTVEISSSSGHGDEAHFPTPLREQEAATAIKALEACAAAAIAELRYGTKIKKIQVDVDKVSAFLMSSYITTLDGMDKADPQTRDRIPDTDLNRAQSVLYRRMSANLYRTKNEGEYYHIHGSLDADVTLRMLGLPRDNPSMTDYRSVINYIESAVMQHTAAELDELNVAHNQAGIQALTWPQFQATPHGQALLQLPPLTVRPAKTTNNNINKKRNPPSATTTNNTQPTASPPLPTFPPPPTNPSNSPDTPPRYALAGIKVLELCRIIAGPTIGRSLAAHGASVLKVTAPHLPDVPFFQLDVNTGKRAVHLDLRRNPGGDSSDGGSNNGGETTTRDRAVFESLLADADVLIDGYRPGALARLGYGPAELARIAERRGKGLVYVAEDCFGGTTDEGVVEDNNNSNSPSSSSTTTPKNPPWASRPGWQQIADCATGAAWAQGEWMGLAEPVVPPFPMSDYGTGALGSLAALAGLYRRAAAASSSASAAGPWLWICRTSLCQYDVFLQQLGLLPPEEQARLRRMHGYEDNADASKSIATTATPNSNTTFSTTSASSPSPSLSPFSPPTSSPNPTSNPKDNNFFHLRHADSVDEVGRRALASMRRAAPHLFNPHNAIMQEAWSAGFGGVVRFPREAVAIQGLRVGYARAARPNGWDGDGGKLVGDGVKGGLGWEVGWEEEEMDADKKGFVEGG